PGAIGEQRDIERDERLAIEWRHAGEVWSDAARSIRQRRGQALDLRAAWQSPSLRQRRNVPAVDEDQLGRRTRHAEWIDVEITRDGGRRRSQCESALGDRLDAREAPSL